MNLATIFAVADLGAEARRICEFCSSGRAEGSRNPVVFPPHDTDHRRLWRRRGGRPIRPQPGQFRSGAGTVLSCDHGCSRSRLLASGRWNSKTAAATFLLCASHSAGACYLKFRWGRGGQGRKVLAIAAINCPLEHGRWFPCTGSTRANLLATWGQAAPSMTRLGVRDAIRRPKRGQQQSKPVKEERIETLTEA